MDVNTYSVIGSSLGIISILVSIVTYINHKRIRSECCGKKMQVSLDIENTTPNQSLLNNQI
jgi:hypothetical protein